MLAVPFAGAASALPQATVQEDKITHDSISEDDRFPRAVEVTQDRIVVTNAHHDDEGIVLVYERTSDGPVLEATLESPFEDDGRLGSSVALDGETLVAGITGITVDDAFAAGAAAVYEESQTGEWTLEDVLVANTPEKLSTFGMSVDIQEDVIVVGEPDASHAPDRYESVGALHVYEKTQTGYEHQAELVPPGEAEERLGVSVAFDGNAILAGAPKAQAQNGAGAVVAYEEATPGEHDWERVDALEAPEGSDARQVGMSVDLDGDELVVGAPGYQVTACCWPFFIADEGDAFAYERTEDGWQFASELDPASSLPGAAVGQSVAVEDGVAYVGAPGVPVELSAGAVHVFEDTDAGWMEAGVLAADDAAMGDRFGAPVAVDGSALVVGAPSHNEAAYNGGAAYVFQDAIETMSTPSSEDCSSLALVTACVSDGEEGPERALVHVGEEQSATVAYEKQETVMGTDHVVSVDAGSPEGDAGFEVTCREEPDEEACTRVHVRGAASDEQAAPVDGSIQARCDRSADAYGSCGTLLAGAGLAADEASASGSATCGFGFFQACPTSANGAAGFTSPLGGQGAYGGYSLSPPGAAACTSGDVHQDCLHAP